MKTDTEGDVQMAIINQYEEGYLRQIEQYDVFPDCFNQYSKALAWERGCAFCTQQHWCDVDERDLLRLRGDGYE